MTRWQKIGAVVSVLWLIGLPIWLGVHSGNWKTVGHAFIVGNSTLWSMMLGPVVLFLSIGVITFDTVRWIIQRFGRQDDGYWGS
jgi:membrane protease YdiL (CAAX protease family)